MALEIRSGVRSWKSSASPPSGASSAGIPGPNSPSTGSTPAPNRACATAAVAPNSASAAARTRATFSGL